MKIEVCVDNIESAITACQAGADRLELCNALALGGLTPSYAFVKTVLHYVSKPVVVMIRPRAGDFLFNDKELSIMLTDIEMFKQLGVAGFVIGALTEKGELDIPCISSLIEQAKTKEITFHRAFDLLLNPESSLETLVELGCHRILTSGQHIDAYQGREKIASYVKQANNRISIMAGAGVTAINAQAIVAETGVRELHLSGKKYRRSLMDYQHCRAVMGDNSAQDYQIAITEFQQIEKLKKLF
ncbi:copper homeostasis protein CutC [Avibacterium paragallinarum]|uniref:copper homeostasis protein CutC n=1 Tax=Avibacterium paragallinarum TaxID=728 RepID=UPI0021F79977|nr:copper homeostasis protein CutC [Avibacterium paragallinarum]UXN37214.1 copper homeostasis protein CutC [Avibacterium paragallinarum]